MLHRLGSPVAAARALRATVAAHADDAESARTLPAPLVAALADAGLFHLCVPRWLGGGESHPGELVETVEEIARADGSAGWCVMVAASTGVLAAYVEPRAAAEVFGPGVATGGVYAPVGTAEPAPGGYRVSGRWSFASGCRHCGWLVGGCTVPGEPPRLALFPQAEATILDTWMVSGLCGTGSADIEVRDLFVPACRSVSLATDRPLDDSPLYRFPVFGLLALGIAAVALGIARGAIDDLLDLASGKTPTGSGRTLAERALVQMQVAQAEAELLAARALVFDRVRVCWDQAERTGDIGLSERALLRAAATHATASSARVVDGMYTLGGGTSMYRTSPLQRRFRDVHAATQHLMVASPTWEVVGRVLLGVETDIAEL